MQTKKSPSANLEAGKGIFFKTGLVLTMVLVLMAFQYRAYDRITHDKSTKGISYTEEDEMPVTIPKPPPPPPPPANDFKVVPDDQVKEEVEVKITNEADDKTRVAVEPPPVPTIEEDVVDENKVFDFVEVRPEFPGGLPAFYEFLKDNLKYPRPAQENNIQGIVYVGFVVEKDGSISNVHLVRGIGGGCDEEAMRVIRKMPPWNPGLMGLRKVRVSFSLPVRFKLEM